MAHVKRTVNAHKKRRKILEQLSCVFLLESAWGACNLAASSRAWERLTGRRYQEHGAFLFWQASMKQFLVWMDKLQSSRAGKQAFFLSGKKDAWLHPSTKNALKH